MGRIMLNSANVGVLNACIVDGILRVKSLQKLKVDLSQEVNHQNQILIHEDSKYIVG